MYNQIDRKVKCLILHSYYHVKWLQLLHIKQLVSYLFPFINFTVRQYTADNPSRKTRLVGVFRMEGLNKKAFTYLVKFEFRNLGR